MVLIVAGYISFTLTGFNLWKIRVSGILGIPLIMLLTASLFKRLGKYTFYKKRYQKIYKESYLENKIRGFDCDGFINVCIFILAIFCMFFYLTYIVGISLERFTSIIIVILITLIVVITIILFVLLILIVVCFYAMKKSKN